jgi:hypothetical protein
MTAKRPAKPRQRTNKRLSLYPLNFDEAVTDILKVKPEPKPPKKLRGKSKPVRLK